MKRFVLLAFPLVLVFVCVTSFVVHASTVKPLTVPCAGANSCTSSVEWNQNNFGAEVETIAKEGNIATDNEVEWEIGNDCGNCGFNAAGLFVTNNMTDTLTTASACSGINTHGTVYAFTRFNNDGYSTCDEIAPSLIADNTDVFIQLGRYSSNGGGYAALFCTVDCSSASGSQVLLRKTCSYTVCGGNSSSGTEWYFSASFVDDGSTYNNNSMSSMLVSHTFLYENTSDVWQYEESGTSRVAGAKNPIQWYWYNNQYPSGSNPGGYLDWCVETVGQSSCS